ncbi:hypothetical protein BDP81DRAFT_434558 [Colletotrichum phormii]|uniref:Uncharacterized protein n=1 Tax=Colletotrichum phormii TaxID=359342 RepID=A0AAJ0EC66_9PEZI|nr:uncharacterized protein BDP81DRAFT_434558 [Colletotrichum phormii]KAK1633263.1 hypothetical protein BDP81DRAFT_434558 [Colletotrichum phormii]
MDLLRSDRLLQRKYLLQILESFLSRLNKPSRHNFRPRIVFFTANMGKFLVEPFTVPDREPAWRRRARSPLLPILVILAVIITW